MHNTTPQEQTTRPIHWFLLIMVVGSTLCVDQLTKWVVVRSLQPGETWVPIPFLEGIFDITYTRNTGAAFGMGQNFGNVFLVIALVVSVVIIYYYRSLPRGEWLIRIGVGLMMGGALGNNAIDRVFRGYVVDFFHLHGWPIFNVADSSIVMGVALWVAVMWWQERQQQSQVENETEEASQ